MDTVTLRLTNRSYFFIVCPLIDHRCRQNFFNKTQVEPQAKQVVSLQSFGHFMKSSMINKRTDNEKL
jgi:hypothetical protein